MLSVCGMSVNDDRKDNAFHEILSPEEAQISVFSAHGMGGYPFCKMFHRKQMLSRGLCFDSSLFIGEDKLFAVQYISCKTGAVYYDHRKPYHYRRGHGSITYQRYAKAKTFDKRCLSEIKALRRCAEYLLPGVSVREAYEICYIQTAEQTLRVMAANDYWEPELYRQLRCDVLKGCWRCLCSPYSASPNKLAVCLSVISPKLSLFAWRLSHKKL